MTVNTIFADPFDDVTPEDRAAQLAELEYRGRRHAENLAGLHKQEAYLEAQIEHHEAELASAQDHLAKVADAGAGTVFEARTAVVAIQFNRDLLKEQKANLQDELLSTPAAIKANEKQIAAIKAQLP